MAQSTSEIKQRIKGIGSTLKITKAMELISTSKMRKARIELEKARPYYNTVLESIGTTLRSCRVNHPLLENRECKKALYIVVTSDRGLAGGYNSNIHKLVHEKYEDRKEEIALITVGSKAREFFKRRNYEIIESITEISEEPSFEDAREIGNLAMRLFNSGHVDEINVVYTKFNTTLSYNPMVRKILPANLQLEGEDDNNRPLMDFEPSPEAVLDYLIPKYVESTIYGALVESSASEQASRRTAMKSATDSAEDMIEDLNMTYNRARQAAITMEISEIVSGAEALN